MRTAWLRRLTPLLILALLAGAVALLHHELSAYRYADVRRAIRALRGRQIEIALALTVVSYVILTTYDALALRYLGRPLAYRRTADRTGTRATHRAGGLGTWTSSVASWAAAVGVSLLIGFTAATFWLGVCASPAPR
jgi:phosphatidylglycerol lysyltransferase